MRRALLPSLCALLLGAAAAIAVGCGGRSHLVPDDAASSMTQQLAAVREDVAAGDCTSAQNALRDAQATAAALPRSVDRRLRQTIDEGILQLERTIPADCASEPATTPETTPSDTTSTETEAPETTTTDTTTLEVPTTTASPENTTTTTVPTTEAPTTTDAPPTTSTDGETSGAQAPAP